MEGSARAWWLVAAAGLVLASPLREVWARDTAPWWTAFALWGALIAAAAILLRNGDDSDGGNDA